MPDSDAIARVKCVVAVQFNGAPETYLTLERHKCTLRSSAGGVEAKSVRSHVFIPWSNIACVEYEAAPAVKAVAAR